MSREQTPLITRTQPPSWREYVHPLSMGVASGANVVGSFFAMSAGADEVKQPDGSVATNPFFYTAMGTSMMYAFANAYEVYRIWGRQQVTWRQIVEEQRAQGELTSVRIDR